MVQRKKKPSKKPVAKKKVIKKTLKKHSKKITGDRLKKINTALSELCPEAHKVSLFHLSVAVFSKHKFYLTGDSAILEHREEIMEKYKITVSDSVHECFANMGGSDKPPELYL